MTPDVASTISDVMTMSQFFKTEDDTESSLSVNKRDDIQQKSICVKVNQRNIPRIAKLS